jgi:hypothetical protein
MHTGSTLYRRSQDHVTVSELKGRVLGGDLWPDVRRPQLEAVTVQLQVVFTLPCYQDTY